VPLDTPADGVSCGNNSMINRDTGGWNILRARAVTLYCTTTQGVNGLDFGRVARGSEPRKATMISLTTRCKPTSADVTSQHEVALAA
jgi:hypothetical protein